jgi:acetyl esterase
MTTRWRLWPQLLEHVEVQNMKVKMRDGWEEEMRIYNPKSAAKEEEEVERGKGGEKEKKMPVVYSLHGGGFIAGSNDTEDLINRQYCATCNALVFALDYRLAPEHSVTATIFEDAEDGLRWVYANAASYGGDVSEGVYASGTSSGEFILYLGSYVLDCLPFRKALITCYIQADH